MRIKTIILIIITVLLTVVIMQNNERVNFEFLWLTFATSKLIVLAAVTFTGFILGVIVGRPKKVKKLAEASPSDKTSNGSSGTLSDDDKSYIK